VPINPVIHYVLHKKYYAEVLCENKDKPKMHCNGKCHLKKELKQAQQESENPNNPIPIPKTNKEIFPAILEKYVVTKEFELFNDFKLYFVQFYYKDIYIEILTPPPEKTS